MNKCEKCDGTGLIGGNPDKPWDHVGEIKTCPDCAGTGKKPEALADEDGDNVNEAPKPGIIKRIFG